MCTLGKNPVQRYHLERTAKVRFLMAVVGGLGVLLAEAAAHALQVPKSHHPLFEALCTAFLH